MMGGDLLLESRTFREYAIRTVVRELNKVTGGRADVENIELQPWSGTAHFYNIILHGTEDPSQPALLHIDKITVRPKIQALLYHRLILNEVIVEHPVVHTGVDLEGENNIPQHSATPINDGSRFDVNINHLLISNGEINYNHEKLPLDAELYDFGTDIQIDSHAKSYRGWISYHNARLEYRDFAPLRHSLTTNFKAGPSHISIESARATVGSSTVFIRGEIDNFISPKVEADYDVRVHTRDFHAKASPVGVAGDISLSGKLYYKHAHNRPLLLNLSVDGQLVSDKIEASSPDVLLEIRKLYSRYELKNGTLQTRDAGAELLGGRTTADINIQHLDTTPVYQVAASAHGVSLQALQQAAHAAQLKHLALSGTLDGTADFSWTGRLNDLNSRCDLRLQASANSTAHGSEDAIPFEAALHVSYNRPRNVITFQPSVLRMSSMTLATQGEVSDHSNLQINAAASDLHQLATLISDFQLARESATAISGSVTLKAMLQGPMRNPRLVGQLSAQNLVVHGSRWSSARIPFQVGSSQVVLQRVTLVNANQGKASLSGSVGLHRWSYIPTNPISMTLTVQAMHVAELQHLAGLHYPASGDLSADINLHGSELDPIGSGTVTILNARIYDEPLQTLTLEFRASAGSIDSVVNVGSRAGSATMNFSYAPLTKSYNLRLNAPSIVLQELQAVRVRNLPLRGVLKASANGEGTLKNPQLSAIVELPQAQFRQNSISQVRAAVRMADQNAEVEVTSQIADAPVQLRGHVNLTGECYSETTVDTGPLQLNQLLKVYWPGFPQAVHGQTELHAVLKGPLKQTAQLEAHVTIPPLNATYESLQIGTKDPIRFDYAHSVVTLQPAELRGSNTSLRLRGGMQLDGISSLNINAEGSVDANLLRIINPDIRSSGVIAFDLRTIGSLNSPSIQGQVQLREFALTTDTTPLGVDKVNGSLNFENNRVQISSLSGEIGGGQLSVAGSILYHPNLQFDITMQTKEVRLRSADGLRMLLDSNLALMGTLNTSTLKGRVLIDSLSFTPDFDLARLVAHFGDSAAPKQAGFANSVKLAIAVQSKNRLSASSALATAEGDVNLQLIGTAASPVITGRTDLTSGEFFYRSRRYQLQRGVVVFNDPNKTRPALDVSVTTSIQQYNLTLTLRGSLDRLTTSYASDPPLATADIINLIAVGNTTQASASHGTDSILASQAAGQVSTRMQNLTGISGLRIDPLVGGSNRNPSARIGIQQRVTKNFLFTFSTDVSEAGGETVEGKYQINKRWSVGVARDQVGGISAEGRYHTKF
jgi:translocation and assembly module TamB